MISVELHDDFIKAFNKRIKSHKQLIDKYVERVRLFIDNKSNPILKDHSLSGNKHHLRSFSITGDIRIFN